MTRSVHKNEIVTGTIWKQLLLFFFPILFGAFFQQLYNTVDAVIVGRFVGTNELAFPCVDKDGEGIFLTVKVIYPHGGKDGPYDGYDMRDAWDFKLKQDEEKAKAAAIKKQKKIEQDKKKREMSAKIKAEMKKQSAK